MEFEPRRQFTGNRWYTKSNYGGSVEKRISDFALIDSLETWSIISTKDIQFMQVEGLISGEKSN